MLRWLEELVYRQSGTYVKNLLANKYPVAACQPSSSPQQVTIPVASALYTIFSIEIRIARKILGHDFLDFNECCRPQT